MGLINYIRDMPKVELHVHLEGTVQPATLLELAESNGVALPVTTVEDLHDWYQFRDFDHFIEIYIMICGCLQTPDDFARITYEYGQAMARQNIRYAEVTWTPYSHVNDHLSFEDLLAGINAGREQARAEWGVEMRWTCDISRNIVDSADTVVKWIMSSEAQMGGVATLGLGGPEVGYPPELFESAFDAARAAGLHSVPHAGETVGPASVWGAIRALQAERIGHGVRAIEDPALIDYLAKHRVPLEVNPTSNLCLDVYDSYADHPLLRLIEAGICVTINSDDPALFNTTLHDEYVHAVQDCGLSLDQLERAALDAVDVSFLPGGEKAAMRASFANTYALLRIQHGLSETEN